MGVGAKKLTDDEKIVYHYKRLSREDQRFVGEKPYVAYFHDLVTESLAPPDWTNAEGDFYICDVDANDKRIFPELKNCCYFLLRVDEASDCISGVGYLERPQPK